MPPKNDYEPTRPYRFDGPIRLASSAGDESDRREYEIRMIKAGRVRAAGNRESHIEIPIPTGLGDGRNLLVVRCSDALVAVSGGFGTLSEIALALKAGRPVIGLDTWEDIPGVHYAEDHLDAIKAVEKLVKS